MNRKLLVFVFTLAVVTVFLLMTLGVAQSESRGWSAWTGLDPLLLWQMRAPVNLPGKSGFSSWLTTGSAGFGLYFEGVDYGLSKAPTCPAVSKMYHSHRIRVRPSSEASFLDLSSDSKKVQWMARKIAIAYRDFVVGPCLKVGFPNPVGICFDCLRVKADDFVAESGVVVGDFVVMDGNCEVLIVEFEFWTEDGLKLARLAFCLKDGNRVDGSDSQGEYPLPIERAPWPFTWSWY